MSAFKAGASSSSSSSNNNNNNNKPLPEEVVPLSAFMFFSWETRTTIEAEFPDMPLFDVGKTVGERWRALTDQERQHYLDLAEQDKRRYAERAGASSSSSSSSNNSNNNKPLSAAAFMFFSSETGTTIKAEFPDMPLFDVGKTVGERWCALTDQERQHYIDHFAELTAVY
jgi:hypothetical protein